MLRGRKLGILGGIALVGCLLVVVVVGFAAIQRVRGAADSGSSFVDDALRREVVAPYNPTVNRDVSGSLSIVSAQLATDRTVRVAVSPPAGSQAMQISQHPSFRGVEWVPVATEVEVEVLSVGYQTLFGRFMLSEDVVSATSVVGVEVDPTYLAATSSSEGDHQPSWVRPFSPTELVVRVEAGRLVKGSLEAYDLNNPLDGDEVETRGNLKIVKRDGETFGFQVSKRSDVIRRPDQLVGEPLSDDVSSQQWTITSSEDDDYKTAQAATGVRHIGRPAAIGTNGDGNRITAVVHDMTLNLPSPLKVGATYTVLPESGIAATSFTFNPESDLSPAVRVNQVGFNPADELKVAYLSGWFDGIGASALALSATPNFSVTSLGTEEVVFSGVGALRSGTDEMGKGDLTGSPVYELNFSELDQPGRFRVCVESVGCSYDFAIGESVWHNLTADIARATYHQRSGIELGPPYTPITRPRPYHPDENNFVFATDYSLARAQTETNNTNFQLLEELGTSEIVEGAWGGHFDAGDWDRRINHLWYARTAAQLVRTFPELYGSEDFNIPESGDAIPDLLDEALWSIDLYRRMQLPDGSIRGGIETTEHPPPNSASWVDDLAAFAYAPDPFSSYIYAGAAAEMAHALKPYDEPRSAELLDSALAAMAWADNAAAEAGTAEITAGQKNVAAAGLLLATDDAKWHEVFIESAQFLNNQDPNMSCHAHNRCDAAWLYLAADETLTDPSVREELRSKFVQSADATLDAAASTAYGWTTENPSVPLIWGLGSGGAPHTSGLMKAYLLTGDEKYRNATVRSASVALGANPLNRTMLTGIGHEPVRSPQINDVKHGGLPVWAGTPVYGHHMLNALDDERWVTDDLLVPAGATPNPTELPYLWQWYDVGSVAQFNEFTVHQSHAEALWTFGTLAATS